MQGAPVEEVACALATLICQGKHCMHVWHAALFVVAASCVLTCAQELVQRQLPGAKVVCAAQMSSAKRRRMASMQASAEALVIMLSSSKRRTRVRVGALQEGAHATGR